ncbi:MAG: alpha-ketoacid dehydrogenase subunit beta [bacterium]
MKQAVSDPKTIAAALNQAHHELMERHDDVVVYGEDVARNGGVFRITDGLLDAFGSERVMDTPLAEAGIVGTAIGMASFGLRPIVEIQFSGFIYPAMDQIVSHLSRMRNRSRGQYTCPVVIRAPYTGGIKAPEHHSESPEAFFCHVPGIKVVTASTPSDARDMLHRSVEDPDPVLLLEPKEVYRSVKQTLPEEPGESEIGTAKFVETGEDLTVISWGAMLRTTARVLEDDRTDYSVDLIDLRTLDPFDEEAIISSVKKTGRAVIVQEAPRNCGLASEIVALINEKAFLNLEAPIKRVTGFDTIMPLAKTEDRYRPGSSRIRRAMKETIEF